MELVVSKRQKILLLKYSELQNHIKIPNWQRYLNHERILNIYNNFKEELQFELPTNLGLLTVCNCDENLKEWNLIDGQHRFMAMKLLYENDKIDDIILINYITISNQQEMDDIFRKINQSTPILLPRVYSNKFNIFKHVAQELSSIYPGAFSVSDNPKRPHMNIQKLSEHLGLYFSDIDQQLLIEKIKLLNLQYQNKNIDFFIYPGDSKDKIEELRKQCMTKKQGCLLGLFKNYEWIKQLSQTTHEIDYEHEIMDKEKQKRKGLSKKIRTIIWDKHIGPNNRKGPCYTCNDLIDINNFDCGHIVSVKNGGEDTIDNLRPICRECNLSCGYKNLDDFKNSLK
jgi:hypothetical protein